MSITKIHLFSKNTDAVASVRGYEYQKLKTLEAWLENSVNKTEELIYCEYEEDIFHRNLKSQSSKFRQLKLYSSNFSFSSEEITKALVHFFSLYTKGDYLFDDVTFFFEANSKVANAYADNDAKLLKSWYEFQNGLKADLLKECTVKTQGIIDKYYSEEYQKLAKDGKVTPELDEQFAIFKKLKEEDWISFVKKIKWKFEGNSPEDTMTAVNEHIKQLILLLPHAVDKENVSSILGVLYLEVSNKSTQELPENRVLTNELLDKLILEQGSENDRWYAQVYEKWRGVGKIEYFSIGEFYEVIDAAQHCRRNKKLWKHTELWLALLNSYFEHADIQDVFKRKAVYEIVWLSMKADPDTYAPTGSIEFINDKLRFNLKAINNQVSEQELEDTLNLINIITGISVLGKSGFSKEEVESIVETYYKHILEELKIAADDNRKCYLLELLGFVNFSYRTKIKGEPFDKVIQPLYDILPLLKTANLYNATQLGRRINRLITIFIRFDATKYESIIEGLEKFSEEIEPYIQERDGKYKIGKINIEKGVAFISSKKKNGILKGLNYFHKAKHQFFDANTIEGYVLATLNISHLYFSLGLNFAAKYYALTSLWTSINNEQAKLLKRIPQSFLLLQHIDFKQGAWLNTIANFDQFVRTNIEFNPAEFDPDFDKPMLKAFSEAAFVIFSIRKITPQLNNFLDSVEKAWNGFWTENILPLVKLLEAEIDTEAKLNSQLEARLDDYPLNDIGKVRTVQWRALGVEWEVVFENTPIANSVSEEFCALFQIFIGEIALSGTDFHLLKTKVKIDIILGDKFLQPDQIGANDVPEYKIQLPQLVTKDLKEINAHNIQIGMALLRILSEISLLKLEELEPSFRTLFDNGLAAKSYTVNTFQRIHKEFYSEGLFNRDKRNTYVKVNRPLSFPIKYSVVKWQDSLSGKYSKDEALRFISNRYKKAYKVMYLTIEKLKNNEDFKATINSWRAKGWLDWQIMLAMMNFMLDYKCKMKIGEDGKEMDEEKFKKIQECFKVFLNMDEKDCYIEFPPEAFKSDWFETQFEQLPSIILNSWNLECRQKQPNLKAIRELLEVRFRFNADDLAEGNLLREV